jgi:uncharacterized protein (DUF1684 family)
MTPASSTSPDASLSREDEYREEISAWRTQQDERMRSPQGWLALTGHYWLKSGLNTIGTASDCDVVLPNGAPPDSKATIHVSGNKISFHSDMAERFFIEEQPIQSVELSIDTTRPESDSPSQISIGTRVRLQLVRRNGRLAMRVRDSESELIRTFSGKKWFDVDTKFRIQARFQAYDPPRTINIINIKGDSVPSEIVGILEFELDGRTYSLDAMSEDSDSLFVLFRDKTSGESTYGSGRFLDTEKPVDGKVLLDFNKAYNPPCAFNPHTLCPIPPKQNRLDFAVRAGERLPEKD